MMSTSERPAISRKASQMPLKGVPKISRLWQVTRTIFFREVYTAEFRVVPFLTVLFDALKTHEQSVDAGVARDPHVGPDIFAGQIVFAVFVGAK